MREIYAVYFITILFTIPKLISGQASINSLGTSVTESFTGYAGTSTLPTNWTTSGTGTNGNVFQGTNQAGGTSGGWYGSGNMSYLGSGTATNGNATWRLRNNTGSTINSFDISFVARMWRSGSSSPSVSLTYSTNSTGTVPGAGALTSILTFSDATTNVSTGITLSQTVSSLSIPNGDYIFIRFVHTGGGSSDNLGWDDISVTAYASANTITTNAIAGSPFCVGSTSGSTVFVDFISTGIYSSNTYTAQLSNSSGSFASPTNIGNLSSDGNSGTITANIPAGTGAGSGYRIRVISNNPSTVGTDNGTNITVNAQPAISTQPSDQIVTSPTAASFSVTATSTAGYQWQRYISGTWTDLTNVAPYSGVSTATLTVSPTNTTYSDYEFRCIVKANAPCTNVISNSAILTVNQGPCISEGFNTGTTAPSGWAFISIGNTYTTSGNYGASSPSLTLDATNDRVTSSTIGTSASELSFWIKGQGTDAASALLVEGWNGAAWVTIDNLTSMPTTGTTKIYNSATTPSLPTNLVQFRFTYTKSTGNLAFDDVSVSCATTIPCTPTATITSFSPSTGPAGTMVNITSTLR